MLAVLAGICLAGGVAHGQAPPLAIGPGPGDDPIPGGGVPSSTLVTTVLKPGVLMGSQLAPLTVTEHQRTYTATDGFGRPVQTVLVQGAPDQSDVVSFQKYNQFGSDGKDYLPFTRPHAGGGGNLYSSTPEAAQASFYQNANRVAHDSGPLYAAARQETSPLGRVLASTAPGNDWRQNPATQFASSNAANDVRRWELTPGSLLNGSLYYGAQQLLRENTADADGRRQETYRDLRGQVVLVRRLADGQTFDTYSVYDEAGRLRYTVPPAAVRALPGSGLVTDQAFVDKWLYQYTYDGRGRPVGRRFPGAGWCSTVYDAYDRPTLPH